jgi:DNA adenine methylase
MQNSIISWVGGKRLLRKHIIPRIPKHDVYCEVFGGAGWVLFGKSPDKKDWEVNKKKYTEIYNDINGELINFWKYIKYHPEAFVTELEDYLVSRGLFNDCKSQERRTELERAVWFYYLLDTSYGSSSNHFCIPKGTNCLPLKDIEKVKKASERLRNVFIENLDFEKLIAKYDSETAFFYLDPPYYKKEKLYKRDGAEAFEGHDKLAEILKNIKGKFLLPYNDVDYIRELYNVPGITIEEIESTYTMSGKQTVAKELLIRNY